MAPARTSTRPVRYPLIIVDWAQDRTSFDWLRTAGPADLPLQGLASTCQMWDGSGRPVTVLGSSVTVTAEAVDPAVRNIVTEWRSRAPVGVMPGSMSGETAIPFLIDDVAVARERLTPTGATGRSPLWLRVTPILLMAVAAVALIPLLQVDLLTGVIAFVLYVLASWGMDRWSNPARHWGGRRDPHDVISRMALAVRVGFWAVTAAAFTLVVLDWAEIVPRLFPWV